MAEPANPPATPLETITLSDTETLLANHGAEGVEGGAGALGGMVAAPLLGTTPTVTARAKKHGYSDSLWGNMLLSMAVQRDEKLQKLVRRVGHVNTMTLLSVAGVSGLGLAQSVYAYNQIAPQSINVTDAHGPNGHDHVHLPMDSRVPSTLGIIGSGVTLATLGARGIMNTVYGRKIAARQNELREQVDTILDQLENGQASHSVQHDLVSLVGERAAGEFLLLWQAVHPQTTRISGM